jgi:hypothetical protein
VTEFLGEGHGEGIKALWHVGGMVFAGGGFLYNGAAWVKKPTLAQGLGALFYVCLLGAEARLVQMHVERRRGYVE